ncbi:MAG: HD domain-containing phosphohydrolase [Bacteriovoracaceae bacterium]
MEDYIPVRLKTLRPDSSVNFDLYIKVGTRFVHYIRDQDPIDSERIVSLKSKKVRKLFIPFDHEQKYLTYLDTGLDLLDSDDLPIEAKAEMVHDTMITSAENVEKALDTEEGFKQTQDRFGKITDFLLKDSGALKNILMAAGTSLDNHHHAATVSSMALGLAAAQKELSSIEMLELGIAALVHDIGKNKLPFDPMTPVSELRGEDLIRYRKHAADSVDLLAGKPYISPRILSLVGDHEEIGKGQGFPNKKNYFRLKLPFQILNLCNAYDRFCFERKITHAEGIEEFGTTELEHFDQKLFELLSTLA